MSARRHVSRLLRGLPACSRCAGGNFAQPGAITVPASPVQALLSLHHCFRSTSSAPQAAQPTAAAPAASGDTKLDRAAAVKRLLYRSKQRGFLELDLLVGLWAERHAEALDEKAVQDLEQVLAQENPDLFKWLTGQLPTPEELLGNSSFQSMRADVQGRLDKHSPAVTRSGQGAEWVRGWDDSDKQQPKDAQEGAGGADGGGAPLP